MTISTRRSRRFRSPVDQWLGLGPATHRYDVDRDLAVTVTDGTRLAATRYAPRGAAQGPVILIRTPYGRENRVWSHLLPRPFAARGYQVVVQDVRGPSTPAARSSPAGTNGPTVSRR